ncbi:MAG: O-antigen ligase family protein [Candidatus Levybacteria bacterium]|nr:O-antigen ligase family protein [Candidatus Levybacteria bacterium]
MNFASICSRIIEYSFYALFFTVPLIFTSQTSELFEFNKMWLTFGIAIIIAAAWIAKMIFQKRILLSRTPLDIPIVLFLASQLIATVFSLDSHVSLWGYYSRFNGGLLSTISYIVLYYAFVSNFAIHTAVVRRLLAVSITSGIIVALWGLPAHFGYDPTCFLFRQTLDVSCWTEDFKPTIRIFSTLGQPNWLAAYLIILIPISIMLGRFFSLLAALFFVDLLFTQSRSGLYGLAAAIVVLGILIGINKKIITKKITLVSSLLFVLLVFALIIGTLSQPWTKLGQLTAQSALEKAGTASSTIRLIVWQGAVDVWKAYPLFGSGVETFAYAYYKNRPVAHNMTSEWDYLYNKAHNEYLNYLATTGAFGLISYLAIIAIFLLYSVRRILFQSTLNTQKSGISDNQNFRKSDTPSFPSVLISIALVASYVGILVSNFFGFSVVIVNLYFFLIPALVFVLIGMLDPQKAWVFPKRESRIKNNELGLTWVQWLGISTIILTSLLLILNLIRFWFADTSYAYGSNLARAGQYEQAYPYLKNAVQMREGEPTFTDEYAFNNAALAAMYAYKNEATKAAGFANAAITQSSKLVQEHPNNVVFWKTQVRIFSLLGQVDPQYYQYGLFAIQNAKTLAPTDAKISYSLAVLYGQTGDTKKAVETLEQTIKLKPDYRDAYYALGLYYHDLAADEKGKVINQALQEKAEQTMQYILQKLSPEDKQATQALETWGR